MLRRRFFTEISGGEKPVPKIQKIITKYNSSGSGSDTILGSAYDTAMFSKLIIDGVEKPVSRSYNFGSSGLHTVEYILQKSLVDMNSIFINCFSLKELDFSQCDLSHTSTIESMLANCYSIDTLNFGVVSGASLRNMSHAFMGCGELTKLDMSNWDISNVNSAMYVVEGCSVLSEIRFKGAGTSIGQGDHAGMITNAAWAGGNVYVQKGTLNTWNWLLSEGILDWGWNLVEV